MNCPHCHNNIQEGLTMCFHCGGALTETVSTYEPETVKPYVPEAVCLHCHNPLPDGIKICFYCGKQPFTPANMLPISPEPSLPVTDSAHPPLPGEGKKKPVGIIIAISAVILLLGGAVGGHFLGFYTLPFFPAKAESEDGGSIVSNPGSPEKKADAQPTPKIDTVTIPIVANQMYIAACDTLEKLDIPYRAAAIYDSDAEAGWVTGQSYNEETQIVTLTVSAGREPGSVPPLPLPLGFAATYVGEKSMAGRFVYIVQGHENLEVLNIIREYDNEYSDYTHLSGRGLSYESDILYVATESIGSYVMTELINYRNHNLYEGYDLRLTMRHSNSSGNVINELRYPASIKISFPASVATPEITAFALINEPVVENEWGNGKAIYELLGNFKKDSLYILAFTGNNVYNSGLEVRCETDGILRPETWVHITEGSAAEYGFIPQRVDIMECVSFGMSEDQLSGTAEFSHLSHYIASGIDEGSLPNLVGMRYMDAQAALETSGIHSQLSIYYEAEHSGEPAGTIIRQAFDAVYTHFTLIISAGPQPDSGTSPIPILLGTTVEPEWRGSDRNTAKARFIVPAFDYEQYRMILWYHPSSGPRSGYWHSAGSYGYDSRPMIYETYYDWLFELFQEETYEYDDYGNYSVRSSYDGEAQFDYLMTVYPITLDEHGYERWLNFEEIPESGKFYMGSLRLEVSREHFLHGISLTDVQPFSYDDNPDSGGNEYFYTITGDHGGNLHSWQPWIAQDETGQRFTNGGGSWTENGMNVNIHVYKWDIENGRIPKTFVIYRRDGVSMGSDGIPRIRMVFDIIDVP